MYEKKNAGRSRPCFELKFAICSAVAVSPRMVVAGEPGTSSIKSVTSETTVQTTRSMSAARRAKFNNLYFIQPGNIFARLQERGKSDWN